MEPPAENTVLAEAMALATSLAEAARAAGDEPIGAVVLGVDGAILAARGDETGSSKDATAHASVLALREAAQVLGSWRLQGATLVATLEPCPLCAGAALSARVARVVIGERDLQLGSLGSRYHVGEDPRLNHELVVVDLKPGVSP